VDMNEEYYRLAAKVSFRVLGVWVEGREGRG